MKYKYLFVSAVLAFAGLQLQARADTIELGTAGNFAVLAYSTVTNTATPTVINGDLGLYPNTSTSITGFTFSDPPGLGTVNGTVHAGDLSAQTAQTDLTTAYTAAAGLAFSTTNNLTGKDLGGLTLTPGVYHFDSSAQLTPDY